MSAIARRPKQNVDDAKSCLGQAVLDGAKSIKDAHYKGGQLPLWVIACWDEMHKANDAHASSTHALQWLDQHCNNSTNKPVTQDCRELLLTLGWNESLHYWGASGETPLLADLLADKMIKGEVLDMMVEWVAERIRGDEDASKRFKIVTLNFLDTLTKAWKDRTVMY